MPQVAGTYKFQLEMVQQHTTPVCWFYL